MGRVNVPLTGHEFGDKATEFGENVSSPRELRVNQKPAAARRAAVGGRSRRRTLCVAAGLLLGGLAIYGNSLPNPFVIDDHWIIERDARITTGNVWALLTQQYWPGDHGDTQLYRPLVLISFAVNRRFRPKRGRSAW
jgi:hypothetical protein